ncbi:CHAD domain-containing protein [Bryobacterales bacterium F-183]|nr:CHAD domain-containing protein [Bryobacterales bacterium F-183]
MSYRFALLKDPGADILRIVTEQLDVAITQLEQRRTSQSKRIHEARKAIKKTRSALRLIRRAIPTEAYDAAITTLRDVARSLAPLRDADVMQQTAAALTNKPKPATAKPSRTPLPPFAAPLHQLKASISTTWPWQDIDPVIIAKGFAQTIRAFQKAFQATTNTNDPELFHTWRKRAKDLRYQSLILEPLWPALFQAIAETAQKTEELLGEDHDLAVLTQHQPQHTAQATERQQQLRRKVRKLGQRLSAEDPKAWKRRIIAWFHL